MDKKEKEKPEPSFPAPYEPFNEELAFDIYELRQSQKEYEKIKSELKNAHGNLKNVSMYDLNYKNKEATLLYYQQNERLLE
ncbi:MAG TPA: hypothetical protein VGE24_11980, partial [Emticicia sp.]